MSLDGPSAISNQKKMDTDRDKFHHQVSLMSWFCYQKLSKRLSMDDPGTADRIFSTVPEGKVTRWFEE